MRILFLTALFLAPGCYSSCGSVFGYGSKDNTAIGQVKRVFHQTPLVCEDWNEMDLSLGVMRNGVGSMSTQDIFMTVPDKSIYNKLEQAAKTGELVKITYDQARIRPCVDEPIVVSVEPVQ